MTPITVANTEANGYRPTNRPGAHQGVGLYGEATVATGKARDGPDATTARPGPSGRETLAGSQKIGTSRSPPARMAPAVVSVSGFTRKCWVTACTSRSRRWSGQSA